MTSSQPAATCLRRRASETMKTIAAIILLALLGAASATTYPTDPLYVKNVVPGLVGLGALYDLNPTAYGLPVCILDNGYMHNHEDLVNANVIAEYDFVNNDNDADWTIHNHGTVILGILGAERDNGLGGAGLLTSPILFAKFAEAYLDDQGNAQHRYANPVTAMNWCAANGAKIINISYKIGTASQNLDGIQQATETLRAQGVLVVASVGNDGGCNPACNDAPAAFGLGVGSVRGDKQWGGSSTGPAVDLVAPQQNSIIDPWRTFYTTGTASTSHYSVFGGSSFAAPIVTGLVSLLWALDDSLTIDEIETALFASAEDLGPPGWDDKFGWGLIRADRAICYLELAPAGSCEGLTYVGQPHHQFFDEAVNGGNADCKISLNELFATIDAYQAGSLPSGALGILFDAIDSYQYGPNAYYDGLELSDTYLCANRNDRPAPQTRAPTTYSANYQYADMGPNGGNQDCRIQNDEFSQTLDLFQTASLPAESAALILGDAADSWQEAPLASYFGLDLEGSYACPIFHPFDSHTGEGTNAPGADCAFNVNEVFAGINVYLADPGATDVSLVFQAINAYLGGPPNGHYSSSDQQFAAYTACNAPTPGQ